jgi:alkanesulfonate monooxygenase
MSSKRTALEVFSTCPRSDRPVAGPDYLREVEDVARWSEENGCKGILVYSDNSMLDPWIVSERILQVTKILCPLVAIQPIYMLPYTAAKMVATFGHLHGRQIYLNMIAGGFKNDLVALNDTTPHDKRYTRLTEYTALILQLLRNTAQVTFEGEFYKVDKLRMTPPLPPELLPGVFVSGSSEAGIQAARDLGAVAVQYPKPPSECAAEPPPEGLECGIRVGIIARADENEAWEVAEKRFPGDRKGELTHQLAMKISDSKWHEQLSTTAENTRDGRGVYWLRPFETYKTFCPYLVGSYESVSEELARYVRLRYETFILDIPPNEEELRHAGICFEKTAKLVGQIDASAR